MNRKRKSNKVSRLMLVTAMSAVLVFTAAACNNNDVNNGDINGNGTDTPIVTDAPAGGDTPAMTDDPTATSTTTP